MYRTCRDSTNYNARSNECQVRPSLGSYLGYQWDSNSWLSRQSADKIRLSHYAPFRN